MDNIIEPNDKFDFSQLSLAHPSGIQGGAYFTKIEYNKKPLYIQTPKSLTRQGIIKSGKKYYCDLMFDKNAETLIHWFENLEEKCQKLIFDKSESWFQNSLEETDIETAFNSIVRVYKSGKYYLVRTNIKSTRTDEPAVKIYNENEVSLTMNDVNTETNMISILEIQGIKFTSRNFQIEVELKQIMILDNEPIFDNCLIKSSKNNSKQINEPETLDKTSRRNETSEIVTTSSLENHELKEKKVNHSEILELIEVNMAESLLENSNTSEEDSQNLEEDHVLGKQENNKEQNNKEQNTIDNTIVNIDVEDLNDSFLDLEDESKELKEVNINFSLENNEETMKLKKPNQVYFELYKEARKKAKDAKKNAIIAYLEAKNIKKTYMIENLNDSDSDFDAEIDEVSESELEQFDI
jgi:hypothetical protein